MESLKKECLEANKIEKFILHYLSDKLEYQKLEHHIQKCEQCKKIFSELRIFYNLLLKQLEKPVAHNVFQLLKNLECDKVLIAGFLLKPQLLDERPGERHFTSEVILSELSPKVGAIDELNFIPLSKDEILIRVIQSTHTNETTLFLYSENKQLYSDVTVKFPEADLTFMSDNKGKVEVGNIDVKYFYNQPVMIIANS